MTVFVARLRAVNVGGTGKLAVTDLVRICDRCGFEGAKTYIQSGNVVMKSPLPEAKVKAALEKALVAKIGKPVGVFVRTCAEIARVRASNPFAGAAPNRVIVFFLDEAPPKGALDGVATPGGERIVAKGREVFVHYPDGIGPSKLKLPVAKTGTGRNLNTVAKLAEMAEAIPKE